VTYADIRNHLTLMLQRTEHRVLL